MFKIFKKKEKPQPRVIVHPELGELKYDGDEYLCEWDSVSAFQIALWDRTYDVSITFYVSENGEEPNLQQVESYRKFKKIVVDQRDVMEKMIMEYAEEENIEKAGNRMIPRDVYFSLKGECALVFEDTEDELPYAYDTEYGVTLFLLPKFTIEGTECSIDYLNGSDDRDDFFD